MTDIQSDASSAASKDNEAKAAVALGAPAVPVKLTGSATEAARPAVPAVPALPAEGRVTTAPPPTPPVLTTPLAPETPVPGPSVPVIDELPPSSALATEVARLLELATRAAPLDLGANLQIRATLAWRFDRTTVQGTRNHEEAQRYPSLPVVGVVSRAYGYDPNEAANPERVIVHNAYDIDWRWRVRCSDALPRHPVELQKNISDAIQESADDISAVTKLTRARGFYFEGKVFMSLAAVMKSRQVGRGVSAMLPLVKLLGYQLSISLPADDGLLGSASIPADSEGHWGPLWQPGHEQSGAALQPIHAMLIGLGKLRDWLTSQTVIQIPAAGAALAEVITPAMIGSKVVIVPVPLAYIREAAVITWYLISKLQYPLKNRYREGVERDWDNNLQVFDAVAANWVNWVNSWYPITSLTSIDGPALPTAAAQPRVMVLFVLTEEYPAAGAYTLSLAGAAGAVNLVLDGAAADIEPVIAFRFQQPGEGELSPLGRAMDLLFEYELAGLDLADAFRFWQCQGAVMNPLVEGDGNSWATVLSPLGAHVREWVDVTHYLPSTAALRRAPPYVPVNGVFAWPGLRFRGAANDPVADPGAMHWELPTHDLLLAVGVVTRILNPVEARPVAVDPPQPELSVPWLLSGSHSLSVAVDLLLVGNAASRAMLYLAERAASPVQVLRRLADAQDAFWGRSGRPPPKDAAPMGPALSKVFFGSRLLLWHPSNGSIQVFPVARVPAAFTTAHTVILGRYDGPTLSQFTSELVPLSSSETVDLTDAGEFRPALRNVARMVKDLYVPIPDPAVVEWDVAWRMIKSAFDGLRADNLGVAEYQVLLRARLVHLQAQATLPATVSGPLTWGSLLAATPHPSNNLFFRPQGWTLTFQRPLGSYDPMDATDWALVVRDRTWAYTPNRYAAFKVAYYMAPANTKWADYSADSSSYVRRRNFRI